MLRRVCAFGREGFSWERDIAGDDSEGVNPMARDAQKAARAARSADAKHTGAPSALAAAGLVADEDAALAEIRALLNDGDVPAARASSSDLAGLHPDWQQVVDAATVLAPPRVRTTGKATGRDRRREFAWLREKAEPYRGQWVALRGDDLVGHSTSRRVLREELMAEANLEGCVFAFVPK